MSWLRNLQDQFTELANEVLNEATEEVADPETELTVAKKNCAEAERKLAIESSKCEGLDRKVKELEEQLSHAHVEMDNIAAKSQQIVADRENEIKKLKNQIERLNESQWAAASDETLQQQLSDSMKESQHWKSLVESGENISLAEHNRILDELKRKRESELVTIMEQNNESLNELREMYEEKIQALQLCGTSSSTSNADLLDTVMLEKEELLEEKKRLEEMLKSGSGSEAGSERAVVVDVGARDELIDERIKNAEAEAERLREEKNNAEKECQGLKNQNKELISAYNELSQEFEEFKKQDAPEGLSNSELHRRLEGMRANLIEYEERYEVCIREHSKTVADLERLQAKFDDLKERTDECQSQQSNATDSINSEVERMREALEQSREDRQKLCADVANFTTAIQDIGVEVESLRDLNETLRAENGRLHESLESYRKTTDELINDKEVDIATVRDEIQKIREHKIDEADELRKHTDCLILENESLKSQIEALTRESELLKEVRSKLMQQSDNDKKRVELFEEKIRLLEALSAQQEQNLKNAESEIDQVKESHDEIKKQLTEKTALFERLQGMNVLPVQNSDVEVKLEENEQPTEELVVSLKKEIVSQKAQLKEILAGFSELFAETESLKNENRGLEKEVAIRQSCVDEMIEQTNTLQMQRQTSAQSITDMRAELLLKTQEYLKLEQTLYHEREQTENYLRMIKNMEEIIVGDDSKEDTGETMTAEEISQMKRNNSMLHEYVQRLKTECQEYEETRAKQDKELGRMKKEYEEKLEELKSSCDGNDGERNSNLEALRSLEQRVIVFEEEMTESRAENSRIVSENERLRAIQQEQSEQLDEYSRKLGEKDDLLIVDMKSQINALETSLAKFQEENSKTTQEKDAKIAESEAEIARLKELLEVANQEKVEKIELQNDQAGPSQVSQEEVDEIRKQLAEARKVNEELQAAIVQKHTESVDYYNQLSTTLEKCAQMEAELQQSASQHSELMEKKTKELQRLKEHLVIVEESSTREAVEAEQRETQLRKRVAELESGKQAAEDGSKTSNETLAAEIHSLRTQLSTSQELCEKLEKSLEAEIRVREQTQEALTSLQGVVQELSRDHDKEAAESVQKQKEQHAEIQKLHDAISDLTEALEQQGIGRQSAEDDVERAKQQMEAKQKIIEELENQIEEVRAQHASATDSSSYRVDDAMLRQLFSNLFMSEASKKADIATLLASILEYPPEQMAQIKKGVAQTFGQTNTTFFRGSPSSSSGTSSLTEQFIRFLEVESESSRTAPHLPIRGGSATEQQQQQQQPLDLLRGSPSPAKPSESTSSTTLDAILR